MIRWRIDKRYFCVERLREGFMDILEYKILNDLHGVYWENLLSEMESANCFKLGNNWILIKSLNEIWGVSDEVNSRESS